jgi:hypothetical protein
MERLASANGIQVLDSWDNEWLFITIFKLS